MGNMVRRRFIGGGFGGGEDTKKMATIQREGGRKNKFFTHLKLCHKFCIFAAAKK